VVASIAESEPPRYVIGVPSEPSPQAASPFAVDRWRAWAKGLEREVVALYFAAIDRRTPWPVRALALVVVAYAVSPIDLIPDFIPILGYLDDLILVPLGLLVVRALIPADVMNECRARADEESTRSVPGGRVAAALIVVAWIVMAGIGLRHLVARGDR